VAKFQANGYNFAMSSLFDNFIDLIFPPRCVICKNKSSRIICENCLGKAVYLKPPFCGICGKPWDKYFEGSLCEDCAREGAPFTLARSVALYDGMLKEAIHKFKFDGKRKLAPYLGKFLVAYLQYGDIPIKEIDLVIPVPLSGKRGRQRGYNQSKLLAEEISGQYALTLDSGSLKKIKDVTPQFELSRKERLQNIRGAFRSSPIAGKNILLVDDIYTTGATAREAVSALKTAGAKNVYVLTLARAVED
jgi:competence protein ComFC